MSDYTENDGEDEYWEERNSVYPVRPKELKSGNWEYIELDQCNDHIKKSFHLSDYVECFDLEYFYVFDKTASSKEVCKTYYYKYSDP